MNASEKRREWGSGSLTEVGKNTFRLRVNGGIDPLTGRRRRKSEIFRGTEAQARKRLVKMTEEAEKNAAGAPRSLAELWKQYLEDRTLRGMTPFNRQQAERKFERYVPEHLAATPISKIETPTLNALYASLRSDRNLGAATVARFHNDIRAAFGMAVKWRWLAWSPAEDAAVPEVEEKELEPPSAEEVATLLGYVETLERDPGKRTASPLPDFVPLLVATGARPAELCALRWTDFDEARSLLTIDESISRGKGAPAKSTKTNRIRKVFLDEGTAALLTERKRRFRERALATGVPLDQWWVFPSRTKPHQPWSPDAMSKAFSAARKDAGVSERVVMRNLRHDAASFLVDQGFDVLAVARRLGHSPQMLLNRYAHVLDGTAARAAEAVGERLRGMRKGS